MNILIGCESSATVRDAFIAAGHNAVSCDLLPTEKPGPHYLGSVLDILHRNWDLAVFHPPCTYLTVSANKWLKDQPERESGALVGEARRMARIEAMQFFMMLWNAPIHRIAIENPIGCMSTEFRKPDQVLQPWMFGHGETKATCLWLKNLPCLIPTNIVEGREQRLHRLSPSADRWRERSRTYEGISAAMASQWGDLDLLQQRTPAKQATLFL